MTISTSLDTLNRAKYSGLDFDTHEDDLLAEMQVKFAANFNDFAVSSLGIMLLDIVSFGLDTLSFYLDRRATDTYLSTARTRASVSRLTRQLGYKMGAALASSVDVTTQPTRAFPFVLPVPKGFQLKGPNGLIFETARAVTFPAAVGNTLPSPIIIPCYQGQTFSESFVSDGTPNQVFTLRRVPANNFVVLGTVSVIVNGTPWTESEFLTFDKSNQFEVGYNDDPPTVRFGDSVAGNIPVIGGTIAVSYVASQGKAGQVSAATITASVNPLVVLGQTIPMSYNNLIGSVGGDDPETIAHAKVFAPAVFKTRLVAVTREDYNSLAGAYADPLFGRVAVAQAISARSAVQDLDLINLLDDIRAQVALPVPVIQSSTTNALAKLADQTAQLATISSALALIATLNTTINTAMVSMLANLRDIKTQTTEISAGITAMQTAVASGKAAVDTLPSGGVAIGGQTGFAASIVTGAGPGNVRVSGLTGMVVTSVGHSLQLSSTGFPMNAGVFLITAFVNATTVDVANSAAITPDINNGSIFWTELASSLTAADAANIKKYFDTISSAASNINSEAAVALGDANTAIASLNGASTNLASVGLTIAQGQLAVIDTARAAIASDVASITADVNAIIGTILTFNGVQATVDSDCDLIFAHVDAILAADCQANLVVVPILARNAGGFYSQPSIGLIQSLQAFLDARKEITQTVSVTDGSGFLVFPVISVGQINISRGYSPFVVKSAVKAAIDGVLRDRSFGVSLYQSDLSSPILAIQGVLSVNVEIVGFQTPASPTTNSLPIGSGGKLDSNTPKNLIVETSEVITESGDTSLITIADPVILDT